MELKWLNGLMRRKTTAQKMKALNDAKLLRETAAATAEVVHVPRGKATLAWAALVGMELVLAGLAYTDFYFTRSGLIIHGKSEADAFMLAAAIGVAMFVFWNGIYLLMASSFSNVVKTLVGGPAVALLLAISWAGGGQWILVDLANTAATREASGDLRRSVEAYLAPADRPGQTLQTLQAQLSGLKGRFEAFLVEERRGVYSGRPGEGPATRATAQLIAALGQSEQGVATLSARWQTTLTDGRARLTALTTLVERESPPRGVVESELQRVVSALGTFPFTDANAVVQGGTQGINAMLATLPTTGRYPQVRADLTAAATAGMNQVIALLGNLERAQLGPQPTLKVLDVKEVVYANPLKYIQDFAHAIALVTAPVLGMLLLPGVQRTLYDRWHYVRWLRRRKEEEAE